ncbi:PEHE domain-containing protein [Phthorimaea operculella]|nr:PEHE domain-containing protein [Phthorimaea operculella]
MNSRSSVNETNLVNFSTDLPTLNQLDTKDGLLSFPFDHIYACHSEGSERRQTLTLDKEVEISTHCVVAEEKELVVAPPADLTDVTQLNERLAIAENQNKKLKDLLIYHLDLIQQQNELITKREKVYQNLKQENDTLKSRLTRIDRRVTISQRQSLNPPPLVNVPKTPVTSTVVKSEPGSASQIMLNSFTELLLPDKNSYLYDSELNKSKTFGQESFDVARPAETDVTSYTEISVPSILDSNINEFTMIESKPSFIKKEIKTENREALYTVTSNSGNPVIQRIQRSRRRTASSLGSLSRMSKSTPVKKEAPETGESFEDKSYDRTFNVNKKSKMINTYGKSRSSTSSLKRTSQFTGSLSDRLQLIDTTPTGEDPYQLGEADMREQSPIPKLMLQKTNHGRMKICTDTTSSSTATSRRSYHSTTETNTKASTKIKMDRYNLTNPYMHPTEIKPESPKTVMVEEPDMDLIKTEPEIDWRMYNPNKPGNETSLCDFSYGETPTNLTSSLLDTVELQDLFSTDSSLNLSNLNTETDLSTEKPPDKPPADKSKKRSGRTTSLVGPNLPGEESVESNKKTADGKRSRKRALSTTGLLKNVKKENAQKTGTTPKPKATKGKAVCRGKRSPVPGMTTKIPYHTLVGDPDLSWYLGLDPDLKPEDIDNNGESAASTVEVPRWREKPYTSCYTMEGTEDLDDKVFEKRHQKLEAEERRQLRWHMRRVREQKNLERLRQRQRDSWCSGGSSSSQPSMYTIWPQPQRDLRFIEITDTLPLMAFGEAIPSIAESDFVLPWVRTSKALKRSKRSKTLH